MTDLFDGISQVIDGYDLDAERARYGLIPAVESGGVTLHRGTARVTLRGPMEAPRHAEVRREHHNEIFTTTHSDGSPVIELGYPTAGSYVACEAGVYLDCQLGVAQKLLDDHHPAFTAAVERMQRHGVLLRREINTDDYFAHGPATKGELHTPQELAHRLTALAAAAFPAARGGYKAFFCNSGTEAVEAGIKLGMLVKYRRFIARYGHDVFAQLMADLGIARNQVLESWDRGNPEPVYVEYPFFVFGFQGAFHGRTLGSLMATQSRRAHHLGYAKGRWFRHFTWQKGADELGAHLDRRPITEILADEGGVRGLIARGGIPIDLAAVFVAEPFQGEGGYRLGDPRAFQRLAALLQESDILFLLDEVQSFARTGRAFCASQFIDAADILTIAKGAFIGAMLARRDLEQYLHGGWHSNTWGGGKLFDNEIAYAAIDALTEWRDPVLDGLTYLDNARIKGIYLASLLDRIQERHPSMLVEHSGLGLMHGMTVRFPNEVIAEAWKRGLKLLGCGPKGDPGRIRLLFLVDALAKEIDDFAAVLDDTLAAVEKRHFEPVSA